MIILQCLCFVPTLIFSIYVGSILYLRIDQIMQQKEDYHLDIPVLDKVISFTVTTKEKDCWRMVNSLRKESIDVLSVVGLAVCVIGILFLPVYWVIEGFTPMSVRFAIFIGAYFVIYTFAMTWIHLFKVSIHDREKNHSIRIKVPGMDQEKALEEIEEFLRTAKK